MKLDLTIDDEIYSLNENANKPLSMILRKLFPSFVGNNSCMGASCGNCLVLVNGEVLLSCLVPAFRLEGASVVTFDGFRKTKDFKDIEKVYEELQIKPCQQCIASKTLLIYSILKRMEEQYSAKKTQTAEDFLRKFDISYISKDLALNSCQCVNAVDFTTIVHRVFMNRSRRNGRKL